MEALTIILVPLVNGVAAKAILDAWFLGSVFADWRAQGQELRDNGSWMITRFFGGASSCRFCFSYHTTLVLSILSLPVLPSCWLLPAIWFASQAVAWWLPPAGESSDTQ